MEAANNAPSKQTPGWLNVLKKIGLGILDFIEVVMPVMIGLSTPPFGMCLFISSTISKAKLADISREIIPMVVVMIVVLLILTYVPVLTTWLPTICGFAS